MRWAADQCVCDQHGGCTEGARSHFTWYRLHAPDDAAGAARAELLLVGGPSI